MHMKLVYILISVFFVSCIKSKTNEPLESFSERVSLEQNLIDTEDSLLMDPGKMILYDTLLVILESRNEYILNFVDIRNGRIIAKCGRRGNGPGEIVAPFSISKGAGNNSINVQDYAKKCVFSFLIDSALANRNYLPQVIFDVKKTSLSIYKTIQINDSIFASSGVFDNKRFAISSVDGTTGSPQIEYPPNPADQNIETQYKALAYQGEFARNPANNNTLLFATKAAGLLDIFSVDQSNDMRLIKSVHYHYPEYTPQKVGDGYSSAYSRDNKQGFVDIYTTSKFIYLLYSGRTFREYNDRMLLSNSLLVYTWDGEPVICYDLKDDVKCFCITDDDAYLYAISITDTKPKMLKYSLDQKLKKRYSET